MALFAHPDRDNISDEAEVSAQMIKYDGRPVRRQVEYYKSRGYPDNGLWAAGILARDNRNRRIRKLGRRWMGENVKWTYQDQISLPYLLWKLRIAPGTIPYNLWDNPLFDLEPHASEL